MGRLLNISFLLFPTYTRRLILIFWIGLFCSIESQQTIAQDSLDIEDLVEDTTFTPYAEYDEETGDYIIYYFRDANTGKTLKSLYVPPTKINPSIKINLKSSKERLVYQYLVFNGKDSKQEIFALDLQIKNNFRNIDFQEGWFYRNYTTEPYIDIVNFGRYPDILPGDSLKFEVFSNYLPGIVDSRLMGKEERNSFSFLFSPPNEVYDIIDSLTTQVASDRGVKLKTVGPKFDPDKVATDTFLDTLQSYRAFSCDTTWIANQGTCRSLEAKLENAQRQVERGNTRPAAGSLQAFLNELNALKEEQISSEAYGLLYHNGQFLLEKLRE